MSKQEVKITGRIFDQQTGKPLKGVKVNSTLSTSNIVSTNIDGYFTINVFFGDKTDNPTDNRPQLVYTLEGYVPSQQEISNLDGTIKDVLPTTSLTNTKVASQQAKIEIQNAIDEAKSSINKIYLSGSETVLVAKRKSIMNSVGVIKNRLVPLAIELLLFFGISKLSQKSQKTCPTTTTLEQITSKRNSVVRELNQIYSSLTLNTSLAIAFLALSKVLGRTRQIVDNTPLPLVSQTYNTVAGLQNVKDTLKELEENNKDLNKQILISLVFLVTSLFIILILLKGLDELIENCSSENNIPFENIEQELLSLSQQTANNNSPIISNFKGFTFTVETERNTVGSLKRRFAVAKNSDGVIILKGEPSFSSTDQILIDELIFYIKQNNLKAV